MSNRDSSSSSSSSSSSGGGKRNYEGDMSINFPDTVDYLKNGFRRNYEKDGRVKTVFADFKRERDANTDRAEGHAGLVRLGGQTGEVKGELDVGTWDAEWDKNCSGLHSNMRVSTLSGHGVAGPLDVKGRALGAQLGLKSKFDKGFDIGGRANAELVGGSVGPVGATIGLAVDTGARARFDENWAVGGEVFGTGVTIGRETKVSLFGTGFSIKWY